MDILKLSDSKVTVPEVFFHISLVIIGSLYLAYMAQLSAPIPFSPVPQTMQTFALFTLAGILGAKRATAAVLTYLFEATCGLPVLAGSTINPLWFFDPRAGYLFAFVVAAYVMGKFLESPYCPLWKIVLTLILGQGIIYIGGVAILGCTVGFYNAVLMGVIPFLLGAACKIAAASCAIKGYFGLTVKERLKAEG